jgi:hypothetical protein
LFVVVDSVTNGMNGYTLFVGFNSANAFVFGFGGSSDFTTTAIPHSSGLWKHYVLTYSVYTGVRNIYVNGVLGATKQSYAQTLEGNN